ncbi:MAG: ribonuclease P protein component [Oscillospiraceae bacterium]|nr:ribonuclease P protein component [Oscillospiraceae bacterium]
MSIESIKKSREFRLLFKKGSSYVTYGFVCYYCERGGVVQNANRTEQSRVNNRFGVVASKKVGNAVMRNRAKRVIREAFRLAITELCEKTDKRYDFVFVARGKTPYLKSTQIYELMRKLFSRV